MQYVYLLVKSCEMCFKSSRWKISKQGKVENITFWLACYQPENVDMLSTFGYFYEFAKEFLRNTEENLAREVEFNIPGDSKMSGFCSASWRSASSNNSSSWQQFGVRREIDGRTCNIIAPKQITTPC